VEPGLRGQLIELVAGFLAPMCANAIGPGGVICESNAFTLAKFGQCDPSLLRTFAVLLLHDVEGFRQHC
jgi:hypothetical protein